METTEFNFEEHKSTSAPSVAELNKLCEEMFKLRAEIEAEEAQTKEKNKLLEEMKFKVQGILADSGLDSFKSTYGTVGTRTINTFKVDPERKEDFLKFIEEKGMRSMLTVNHQTLQAYCRSLYEENKANLDFSIPGVGEPQPYTTITMRKG